MNPQSNHPSPPRRARSLRQEYEEFVLQRIEEYKEQLSRSDLMNLGDEAVRELEAGPEGQLVLTEVLMLDHVDRLITKRLRLPAYRRWRQKHLKLRQAQQEPTHWGLPSDIPHRQLAHDLGDADIALVVGARLAPVAFLLAAHDANVLLIDQDLGAVEATESRAASEALASRFQALVINLGGWFPDVQPHAVVIDPHLVGALDDATRAGFMSHLKNLTSPGGRHLVISLATNRETPEAREGWVQQYGGWATETSQRAGRVGWVLAQRPPRSEQST